MTSLQLQRPALVVCDMDGLLVDSERVERRVWLGAANEHGVEMSDGRFASFVGHPMDECERMLVRYYGADFDVAAFRTTCHRHMREIVEHEGIPLRDGAEEWLSFVRDLGIPLALATSSAPHLVRERLGQLVDRFTTVVTRADVARGKPHPDLYLEVAARAGLEPQKALALEDSPTGARAAVAAHMPVVVIPDLVQPPDDLVTQLAAVFPSLNVLRSHVAQLWGMERTADE